jgi:hypothetical protein
MFRHGKGGGVFSAVKSGLKGKAPWWKVDSSTHVCWWGSGGDQWDRRLEGWPNMAARLTGWRRVTQQGVILYVMNGPCRLPWWTTPLAPVWGWSTSKCTQKNIISSVHARKEWTGTLDPCLLSGGDRLLLVRVVRVAVSYVNARTSLRCRPNSTMHFLHRKTVPSRRGHHYGGTWPGFSPSSTTVEHPRHTCPCRGLNPRPLALPDSLFTTIRNIYMRPPKHQWLCTIIGSRPMPCFV